MVDITVSMNGSGAGLGRRMAGHTYLVAFRVSEIGPVIGWSVFGPESRLSLADAAIPQRHGINLIDDRPAWSQECGHLPVPHLVGTSIVWLTNDEQRTLSRGGLPACPGIALFAESLLQPQRCQYRTIEGQRTLEIGYANVDMGKHRATPYFLRSGGILILAYPPTMNLR